MTKKMEHFTSKYDKHSLGYLAMQNKNQEEILLYVSN